MSGGFRDTFTKDSEQEDPLGYDDAAFYYFAASVLVTFAVPWSYYFLKGTVFPGGEEVSVTNKKGCKQLECKTSAMVAKHSEADSKTGKRRFGWGWWLQLAILSGMWFAIHFVYMHMGVEEVGTFDPFKMLEVSTSATPAEIKKAYRKLSLIYHPDKNANDPMASARFIQITKAYNALTDPIAKDNYEKYGNPDGPTMSKVGIGLPKFLLEKDNQVIILVLFFFILLFVIPMMAICYWQRTKNYAANGVLIETLQLMEYYINESTRLKNCPELLAASAESRDIPTRMEDQAAMNKLKTEVEQHAKSKFPGHPVIQKNCLLLLGHMQRLHHLMTPELRKDLEQLLRYSVKITQATIEYSCARDWFFTAQSMIEFRRCLIQGLDVKSSPLLQIPHFDEEVLKHCTRGKNASSSLWQFINRPPEERKGLKGLTPEQLLDIEAFCSYISNLEVEAEVSVEDETEIVLGDIATVSVKLTRTNLREGEAVGPVHAPLFPEPKLEEWWLFLTEPSPGNRLISMERIRDTDHVVNAKMRFEVTGKPGKKKYELHAMCDSYVGIDKKLELNFTALSEEEANREIFVHKEDEDLDLMPTLFQQMMGDLGAHDDESDDEQERRNKTSKPSKPPKVIGESAKGDESESDNDGVQNDKGDADSSGSSSDSE